MRPLTRPAKRRLWLGAALAAAVLLAALAALLQGAADAHYTLPGTPSAALCAQSAQVHILDVGQGDCVLLRQGHDYALIDSGPPAAAEAVVAYLQRQGVGRLRYLVLTHFHADHIGGAQAVLRQFAVDTVLLPDLTLAPMPTSSVALQLLEELSDRAETGTLQTLTPKAGDSFPLGAGTLSVLGGGLPCQDDPNNTSLITLFQFDDFAFFSAGDAEAEAEAALLADDRLPHADLYKVSHHGSSSSNTPALLARLAPLAAVVSCQADNDYGHPHAEVLATLRDLGIEVYRTDQHGSVVVTVRDGTMTIHTEKGG